MKNTVFISYSSSNKDAANKVCEFLEINGISCWIAPRNIKPGKEYGEEIINGIENSNVFVLIYTQEAVKSPHVLREVERAVSKSLSIFSYMKENVPPSKSLEYFLYATQWIDACETDRYEDLLQSIKNLFADNFKSNSYDKYMEKIALKREKAFYNQYAQDKPEDKEQGGPKESNSDEIPGNNTELDNTKLSNGKLNNTELNNTELNNTKSNNTKLNNTKSNNKKTQGNPTINMENKDIINNSPSSSKNNRNNIIKSSKFGVIIGILTLVGLFVLIGISILENRKSNNKNNVNNVTENFQTEPSNKEKPNMAETDMEGSNIEEADMKGSGDNISENNPSSQNANSNNEPLDYNKININNIKVGNFIVFGKYEPQTNVNSSNSSGSLDEELTNQLNESSYTKDNANKVNSTKDTNNVFDKSNNIVDKTSIEWVVLDIDKNEKTLLLASKCILDFKPFDVAESGNFMRLSSGKMIMSNETRNSELSLEESIQVKGNNDYQTSNIKTWLNSDDDSRKVKYDGVPPINEGTDDNANGYDKQPGFLHGFSNEEKQALVDTENGKVFLFSKEEVEKYFDEQDIVPYTGPTQSAYLSNKSTYYYSDMYENQQEAMWVLRTPVEQTSSYLYAVGYGKYGGEEFIERYAAGSGLGIRPGIKIKLK